jgi:hypothetical protein
MSTETELPSRIKTTWLIGVLAAFAIFVVIAWYSGHMTRAYTSYDQQRATDRYLNLQKVRADEDKQINGPADWVDQSKGIIHIPIDEAMAKEVDTLKTQSAQIGSALPLPPAPAAPAKPDATKPDAGTSTNAAPVAPAKPDASASTNAPPAAPAKPTK